MTMTSQLKQYRRTIVIVISVLLAGYVSVYCLHGGVLVNMGTPYSVAGLGNVTVNNFSRLSLNLDRLKNAVVPKNDGFTRTDNGDPKNKPARYNGDNGNANTTPYIVSDTHISNLSYISTRTDVPHESSLANITVNLNTTVVENDNTVPDLHDIAEFSNRTSNILADSKKSVSANETTQAIQDANTTNNSSPKVKQGDPERNQTEPIQESPLINSSLVAQYVDDEVYNSLPLCPEWPPLLVGKLPVSKVPTEWPSIEASHPEVGPGGWWRPAKCRSRHHVAIVIPYRDRDAHLRVFVRHLSPILQRQQLNYRIFVVEQNNGTTFNRGMLMNIGFAEALKVDSYKCFVFSDVDMLPENDRNIYGCPQQPRHLCPRVDTLLHYRLFYKDIFGGVENFLTEHYQDVNGFSNVYFGWGCEDDDLYKRIVSKGYTLARPLFKWGKYTMNTHEHQDKNVKRGKILRNWKSRMDHDGLNSLVYNVTRYDLKPLYTLISVDVDQNAIMKKFQALGELDRK